MSNRPYSKQQPCGCWKALLPLVALAALLLMSACTTPADAARTASPLNAVGQSPFAQTVAALRNRGVSP